ncbi:MAG: circularly permuted type 2 ATP-grasp protein [Gloeomargarita sp. GMQP_bins_25]
MHFHDYDPGDFYDEWFVRKGEPRPHVAALVERINQLPPGELRQRQQAAQAVLMQMGVTFQVYNDPAARERIWPFDVVPRVITAQEWAYLERGVKQRVAALNLFLQDVYHDQKIIKDRVIPADVIYSSQGYLPACQGLSPPGGIWCHITGSDLVRDRQGHWWVLEDNLRVPSGISYVLENRRVMKNTFPKVFRMLNIRPTDDYPGHLLEMLLSLAPGYLDDPCVVVLTPGVYNSAYFEHSFLAQQMGVELVEGRDLVVVDGYVQMRTTRGLQRVDVIYRRIDDVFLDPQVFRADSLLGIPGLMEVYRQGRVALANAPGTGVADDKVVYAYVPDMIRYYLGEEPLLPNVPTYLCWQEADRDYVLKHLDQLVVKSANESGGYGMLMGHTATPEERAAFAEKIQRFPRNYIAQPVIPLSRVPTIVNDHFEGRHVDLRPYVLHGQEIYVHPGGLTRVALKKGSLVVNSSQGGGSKDTWVLAESAPC